MPAMWLLKWPGQQSQMPIKWIGNTASHDDLTVEGLKLCFEIVETLLEELYGTGRLEMERAIKRVNRRKKP